MPALAGILAIVALGVLALRVGASNLRTAEADRLSSRQDTVDTLTANMADNLNPANDTEMANNGPFAPGNDALNATLLKQFATSDDPGAFVGLLTLDGRTTASIPAGSSVDVASLGPQWAQARAGEAVLTDLFVRDGVEVSATLVPMGRPAQWGVIVLIEPFATGPGQAFNEQLGSLNGRPGGLVMMDRQGVAVNHWSREHIGDRALDPTDVASLPDEGTRLWTASRGGTEVTYIGAKIGFGYSVLFEQETHHLYGDLREAQRGRDTVLLIVLAGALAAVVGLGLAREVSARRAEDRVRALLRNSRDLVLVAAADGTLRFVSPAIERLLGCAPATWVGRNLIDVCHPDDEAGLRRLLDDPGAGPLLNVRLTRVANGHEYQWFDLEASDLRDHPEVAGMLLTAHEIGERKRLQDELRHQATHDRLTGLPNRAEFTDRLEHMLREGYPARPFALLYVDLDHFKPINDTMGHDAGDAVLVTVAQRLKEAAGAAAFVSRLGGDEFAVLVDGADRAGAVAVAGALLVAARAPVAVGTRLVNLDASIGIALADPDTELYNAELLVRLADAAMYEAKQAGRGRYAFADVPAIPAPDAPGTVERTQTPEAPADPPLGLAGAGETVVPARAAGRPARRRSAALVPILVAASLVTLIAALGWRQTTGAQRAAEAEQVRHSADFAARAAEFYGTQMSPAPLTTAASNAPFTLDGSGIDQLVTKAFATAPISGSHAVAVLSTVDGRPLAAYPEGTPLTVGVDTPIWQEALAGRGALLSRVDDPDGPRTYYVLPVLREGRPAAVLALGLSLRTGPVQRALEQGGSAGYTTGGWSMIDGNGVVYSSWDPELIGTRLAEPAHLAGLAPGSARDLSNEDTVLVASPGLASFDRTYLVFSIPAQDYFHGLRLGQRERSLAFLGLVAGAIAGLVFVNHRRERALRRSEARLDALVQQAHDVVVVIDDSGRTTYVSSAVQRLLGYAPDDLRDRFLLDLIDPGDRARTAAMLTEAAAQGSGTVTDLRVVDAAGGHRWFDVGATDLRHHREVRGLVLTCHEVTERRALQHQLAHRALHDPLTGLPNRATLARRMADLTTDEDGPFAVLFVDLDHFKPVNDTLGHDAGDEVLRVVAARFRRNVRVDGGDLVCRLGGDEFAIVLRNTTEAIARATADRLIDVASEAIFVGEHTVRIGATIGISVSHPSREDPDVAIRNADHAMYQAKAAGRGSYAMFAGVTNPN